MLHIDNFFIAHVLSNKQIKDLFLKYLKKTNIPVLLDRYLLLELIRYDDSKEVKKRIDFIKSFPNVRILVPAPVSFIYQEIKFFILNDRIPTKNEFKNKFTVKIKKSSQIDKFVNEVDFDKNNIWAEIDYYTNSIMLSKVNTEFGKQTKSRKIREYFEKIPDPSKPVNDFEFYELNYEKHLGKGHKIDSYKAFQDDFVSNLRQISFNQLQNLILSDVQYYGLDLRKVMNWTNLKYYDRIHFLMKLRHVSSILSENEHKIFITKYKKLKNINLTKIRGYYLNRSVHKELMKSSSRSKASDFFDLFYLHFAPYLYVFLCDKDICDKIRRVNKQLKLDTIFYNEKEFIQNISN